MNPYELRHDDLFDHDPRFEESYHQDFQEGIQSPLASAGNVAAIIVCCIPVVYHILYIFDYDLLPLPELFWNILVCLTPARLLDVVENYQNPLRISNPALAGIPRTHAAKSEAMRRILGMDSPGGIMAAVGRAGGTRLASIQSMATQKNDEQPAGLGNWDNSCYQNSVLQGLASLESLSGYLANPRIESVTAEVKNKPEMKMTEALRTLIAKLNDPESNGMRIWTPATLKNMSSWQQQDAQEYFSKVLDEIDKEIGKAAILARESQGLEADQLASVDSRFLSRLPISTFRNPLEGLVAQRVGCTKCGFSEGLTMTPFNCLTVPLTRAWEHALEECLDEYTKLELIEGVECGKCTLLKTERLLSVIIDRTKDSPDDAKAHEASKERLAIVATALEEDDYEEKTLRDKCKINPKSRVTSTKTRQAVIARPPKSLVVHINRSLFDETTGELRKNSSRVRFPKHLDLGAWCLGSTGTSDNENLEEWLLNPQMPMISSSRQRSRIQGPLYEIRGVVTHYGRHENGHYICYRKHPVHTAEDEKPKTQWWRLSDDDVMKVSEDQIFAIGDRDGVFMLFYECIEATQFSGPPATSNIPITYIEPADIPLAVEEHTDAVSVEVQNIADEDPTIAAVNIPLPDLDDDVSDSEYQDSISPMREESIATTISEFDADEVLNEDSLSKLGASSGTLSVGLTNSDAQQSGQARQEAAPLSAVVG